jgi:hypothetical protein
VKTGKPARTKRWWHEKNLEGAAKRWRCGTEMMVVAGSKQQQAMAAGCVMFPGRRRDGEKREVGRLGEKMGRTWNWTGPHIEEMGCRIRRENGLLKKN